MQLMAYNTGTSSSSFSLLDDFHPKNKQFFSGKERPKGSEGIFNSRKYRFVENCYEYLQKTLNCYIDTESYKWSEEFVDQERSYMKMLADSYEDMKPKFHPLKDSSSNHAKQDQMHFGASSFGSPLDCSEKTDTMYINGSSSSKSAAGEDSSRPVKSPYVMEPEIKNATSIFSHYIDLHENGKRDSRLNNLVENDAKPRKFGFLSNSDSAAVSRTLVLQKTKTPEGGDYSSDKAAEKERAWIRRWRHRGGGRWDLRRVANDGEEREFPSFAAMALMGKAARSFQPCKFKRKGHVIVWNAK